MLAHARHIIERILLAQVGDHFLQCVVDARLIGSAAGVLLATGLQGCLEFITADATAAVAVQCLEQRGTGVGAGRRVAVAGL
ncbi:hypothetical protein D3C81_1848570 [compost metagenome]